MRTLSPAESRSLLRDALGTGHIGLSVKGLPVVMPVVFTVDDEAIMVWGGMLDQIALLHVGDVVAFQADGEDAEGRWSVMVRGRADLELTDGNVALCIPAELVEGQRF